MIYVKLKRKFQQFINSLDKLRLIMKQACFMPNVKPNFHFQG